MAVGITEALKIRAEAERSIEAFERSWAKEVEDVEVLTYADLLTARDQLREADQRRKTPGLLDICST